MSTNIPPPDFNGEFETGLEVAKEFLSPRVRRLIYAIISILGYVLGAVSIGFAAAGLDIPTQLIVAMSILGFLIGPVGQLAATNTVVLKSEPIEAGSVTS